MNNDAISRSLVMDYLREQQASVIIEKNKNGFVSSDVYNGMSSAINAFINFIVQMPTTYDIDKIIKQLEEHYMEMIDGKRKLSISDFFEYAVNLIKSGGIE